MIKAIARQPGGYKLRVELEGIEPAIWRLFTVPAGITLGDLHIFLQAVMGWDHSHLHQFHHQQQHYGIPSDEEFENDLIDEDSVTIDEFFKKKGSKLIYEYDFGDGWEHLITCKETLADEPLIAVLDGARACPPEDCGGIPGYYDLIEALSDPKNESHEELKEWVDADYDPERFDAAKINKALKKLRKRK